MDFILPPRRHADVDLDQIYQAAPAQKEDPSNSTDLDGAILDPGRMTLR
jgi:hypothetical protein